MFDKINEETMRKVLLIETASVINGGQKMSLLVSDMLVKTGKFDVIWVIPEEGLLADELKQRSTKYYLLGNTDLPAGVKGRSTIIKYGRLTISSTLRLNLIIKREKINIIYTPGPAALPWAAICGAIMHRPVIWHLHHTFIDGPTKKLISFIAGFRSVKKIIAVSNFVGSQIIRENSISKMQVLYNPVDYNKYSSGDRTNILLQQPFSFATNASVFIGHIALIEPEKRQETTVRVVEALRKKGYDAFGVIIGKAKPENEQYITELKNTAVNSGITPYIYYLGFRHDVQDILRCIDIEIIPSIEGFPLAGLEACSAGVPVVTCDVGGAKEFVEVSGSGCYFRFDDSDDAAVKIIECMKNRKQYSENGQRFALHNGYDCYSEKLRLLFEQIEY